MLVADDKAERLDAGLGDGEIRADPSAAGDAALAVSSNSMCSGACFVEVLK